MDDMNAHVQEFSLIFNEDKPKKKKKNSEKKNSSHLSYAGVMRLLMILKLVFLIN
jgi:hypothetical protein